MYSKDKYPVQGLAWPSRIHLVDANSPHVLLYFLENMRLTASASVPGFHLKPSSLYFWIVYHRSFFFMVARLLLASHGLLTPSRPRNRLPVLDTKMPYRLVPEARLH